nr:NADH-quinone oxidoreductase subunit NuoF [Calderihabitans maritimus]
MVGLGSCGVAAGGNKILSVIKEELKNREAEVKVESTGCIGLCYLEPLVNVVEGDKIYIYGKVTPEMVSEIIDKHVIGKTPVEEYVVSSSDHPASVLQKQVRIALRNCGIINPENIDDYIGRGGYEGIKKAVTSMSQKEVIEEIKASGLRGRGGAGFPTWFKWNATREAPGSPKYVVCNADEGDPGAFMDRSILEGDPHSLLEGMMIAGYAIGAQEGIIYVRAEYPLAIKRLEIAIEQAEARGLLGENLFGSDFNFTIRIKQGAGAFVCGEETALIASLEGERGMPRLKPPFPAQSGYWGKPTNINNVETYANVPWILQHGGAAFARYGTEKSKGTKVFALAGKIKHGGLVEVPMGLSLREVIFDIGGGIKGDREIKAVQMGGPSGGCIPAHLLDTPVDYESITKTGAIMGSGGMIVMDDSTCMVDMARFFLDFTQKESCGKCTYCRLGTKRMLEILNRITEGKGKEEDLEILESLALRVKEGSLCGLGQTAPNPVLTTLRYFRGEYEAHIREKRCPSKHCKALITYVINKEKCRSCGLCAKKCPVSVIEGSKKEPYHIRQDGCMKCGNCKEVCPFGAVEIN